MLTYMQEMWDGFMETLIAVLPISPFQQFIDQFSLNSEWLGYLNWFFPVTKCLEVLAAWVAAIAVYYAYSIVMRWVKVIA